MRHRSTTRTIVTPTAKTFEDYSPSGTHIEYNWGGKTIVDGFYETIDDEIGDDRRMRSCLHTSQDFTIHPAGISHEREPGRVYSAEPYALFNRAFSVPGGAGVAGYAAPVLPDWSRLSSYALSSMLPTFRQQNSLVNFVLELKDVKRIPDVWSRKRSKLKNLANLHLNYAFGIAPLISDVTSIVTTLAGFNRKIDDLRKGAGKPIVRHYRCPIGNITLPSESRVYEEGGGLYEVFVKHSWVQYPMYSATCRFTYEMPDVDNATVKVRALLDALGVNANLAIRWNAIKFSFVMDWLVRVADFLGDLAVPLVEIPVTITDFCHSAKYVTRSTLSETDFGRRTELATSDVRRYERRRETPAFGVPLVRDSDLSAKEVLLGLSLLVSNSRDARVTRRPIRSSYLQMSASAIRRTVRTNRIA